MVQRLPSKTVAYAVSVLQMDTGCFSGRCLGIGRDAKVSSIYSHVDKQLRKIWCNGEWQIFKVTGRQFCLKVVM